MASKNQFLLFHLALVLILSQTDPLCAIYDGSNCGACFLGYYINGDGATGLCTSGDPNCIIFTTDGTGHCATCKTGLYINGDGVTGACTFGDLNCAVFKTDGTGYCDICIPGFYINGDGVTGGCTLGDFVCTSFTINGTGLCDSCPSGNNLFNGQCVDALPFSLSFSIPFDPYCSQFSFNTGSCNSCFPGYFISGDGINGKCTFGSQFCASFTTDGTGKCGNCWTTYTLSNGACSPIYPSTFSYCAKFSGGSCTSCYRGYYIDGVGVSAKCIFGNYPMAAPNPYCLQYFQGTMECSLCSPGYYTDSSTYRLCRYGDQLCHTFTTDGTGSCASCRSAYTLLSGSCILKTYIDPFCAIFIPDSTTCIRCLSSYYINGNGVTGKCTFGSQYCANFTTDGTGKCGACWLYYTLQNGNCVLTSRLNLPPDPFCAKFGLRTTTCISCVSGYYINGDGVSGNCTFGNQYCASFTTDGTGKCAGCWPGYSLSLGVCSFGSRKNDPFCSVVSGTLCLKCYSGYYINGNGVTGTCVAGNQFCANYTTDGSGRCGGCWPGYTLQTGNCVVTSSLNLPRDPFCLQFASSTSTTCISCHKGYFININVNGKCAPANQFCATYAMLGGACTSCYRPYRLSGRNPNTCVYP